MPEIRGKQVEFVDHLPAEIWWGLAPKIFAIDIEEGADVIKLFTYEVSVDLCRGTVASWEFEGDPSDQETYKTFDFRALQTLVQAAYIHACDLFIAENAQGEVDGGPTAE